MKMKVCNHCDDRGDFSSSETLFNSIKELTFMLIPLNLYEFDESFIIVIILLL